VVRGDPRDYRDAHSERRLLIVEVSLSRLGFDREHAASAPTAPRINPRSRQ
jgi:hypothetical protein